MSKATIVYWYGGQSIPMDGGGRRALAWKAALSDLGYTAEIVGLGDSSIIDKTNSTPSLKQFASRAKKLTIPLPFPREIQFDLDADITVAAVPAIFDSVARSANRGNGQFIFDWMDLWSVYASTVGRAKLTSRIGGAFQSANWSRRETRLASLPMLNTFAGHGDMQSLHDRVPSAHSTWLPNPQDPARFDRRRTSVAVVGFIGNMDFPPNELAIRWFFRRYADEIRSSKLTFVIAGYGSERASNWGLPAEVLGRVDDLRGFYDSIDAALVPAIAGGGIKAKAVEAMAYGVPVFGTGQVASGFDPLFQEFVSNPSLLFDSSFEPPIPSLELFENRFSQRAFSATVARLVSAAG